MTAAFQTAILGERKKIEKGTRTPEEKRLGSQTSGTRNQGRKRKFTFGLPAKWRR